MELVYSNGTGLQSQIPCGLSVPLLEPQVGKSVWALELSQQCENFFGIIVLRFVGRLLSSSAAAAKSFQSCPTLCDPIDGSPPGSPVPGILQARTLV